MTSLKFCWKMTAGWVAGLIGTIGILAFLAGEGWLEVSDALIIGGLVILLDVTGIGLMYWRSHHPH